MDERELDLIRLLKRPLLSTDHGKKPLLIEREYLDDALHRREVEFIAPDTITPESLDRLALAFYDTPGEPRSLPLKQVAELGFPISTKFGTYIPTDGYLVPYFSKAQLIAGAFLIATKLNPNELKWFLVRDRGSIFHSAIEQIEAPKVEGAPRRISGSVEWKDPDIEVYIAWNSVEALDNAKKINRRAAELGTVYLTADWHPLDSKAVTTSDLYEHAIATLLRFGYEVRYSWIGKVEVKKASSEEELVWD